ncbi:MAG: DUF3291 domain-containing protein [Saprospiraceae bacterium]
MPSKQLAEVNIARCKFPLESPEMKEFVDFLAPVNQLAEESPGFIWRLVDEDGRSATEVETPFEDDMIIVNMSVWKDLDSLKDYIYNTVHSYFLKNRKKWFDKMETPYVALWWVAEGHESTVEEAAEKLALIEKYGSTAEAFTLREFYDADGLKT